MPCTDVSVTLVRMYQRNGGALLRAWLKSERRTQQWLAEQIGNSQTNISAWILGPRPPPLEVAVAIRRVTGIEVDDWTVPAESESGANINEQAKAS